MNRFYLFLYLCAVAGCLPAKHTSRRASPIVYKIFDSLDRYLEQEISDKSKKNSIQGIIIDIKCNDCYLSNDTNLYFNNLMAFSIVYDSEVLNNPIFKTSNRFISVGGKLYSVFFIYIDNVLCRYSPNTVYDDGKIELPDFLSNRYWVIADMARKEYYIHQEFGNDICRGKKY